MIASLRKSAAAAAVSVSAKSSSFLASHLTSRFTPIAQQFSFKMSTSTTSSFLVTKNMSAKYYDQLSGQYQMDMWEHPEDISRGDLLKRVKGKSGILVTLTDKVNAELLDAAGPQLKIISTLSVGYDHIDVEECRRRGVLIGNTPDVLTGTWTANFELLPRTVDRSFDSGSAVSHQLLFLILTDAVAELTMALLLATLRRFFEAHKALRE